ncbi:THUMP domain-containing class I SAM-dependent RNA methyltransferase [Phaeovulum vinaykumarii]|uniref:Putative N6-adenine-specific DNA methylase n=1 Tax=Phaeovulum vinaykumarii TaxID=407234 RepID=A0A1N7KWY0_9RHOB|nr:RNA methyltransferase [Phaeovulum vinaykumarii]SIS65920.1 putative N6-adenine-specific DNA methylase [Phaeovulum vinaykumarii]SOC01159.1 putative N6-adenine-specific DNA methylase [Phaeovulum vinaykumarii]
MDTTDDFEIFLVATPGLEGPLLEEARERGFAGAEPVAGGIAFRGGWPEVWRANLEMRGAAKVLARIGAFRAMHLAQLDKRARKFPWAEVLRADVPVKVEATCRRSRIYHAGAAAQRIARALTEELGAPVAEDAPLRLMARIEDDLVTLSLDTSGEPLHRRGHKEAVNKAPLRETLAALFLRECGYDGTEPLVDPMCGSGTFPIEAAEIAAGLAPGRARRFAFEDLASFDPAAWADMRAPRPGPAPVPRYHGYDRDAGAIRMSTANAARAGVEGWTRFACQPVSDLVPPEGGPGLVMVNPPYGARIGNRKLLFGLYATLGQVLQARFQGWRVGLVTADAGLAKVTGLPFLPKGAPVAHGGMKVWLHRTDILR